MICAAATACVVASCWSRTSAGGQLSQPSDVNRSTTTGVGGSAIGLGATTAHAIATSRRIFRITGSPINPAPDYSIRFGAEPVRRFHLAALRLDYSGGPSPGRSLRGPLARGLTIDQITRTNPAATTRSVA